jgi:hypothetical protein
MDESQLGDFCLEGVRTHAVVDRVELSQQIADPTALIAIEVGTNPGPEVGRLPDIDDLSIAVFE